MKKSDSSLSSKALFDVRSKSYLQGFKPKKLQGVSIVEVEIL